MMHDWSVSSLKTVWVYSGMIGVAIASAFGFFFMCDFYMNPAIFSVMPLLALGIGVDDMFTWVTTGSPVRRLLLVVNNVEEH